MKIRFTLLAGMLLMTAACTEDVRQAQGFSLPEGDLDTGRQVFVDLHCNDCHRVSDIAQETVDQPPLSIELGGEVTRIKTYGELVTSIINPSHRVSISLFQAEYTNEEGESLMRNYNEVMTVQELIDLVAFLQSEYKLQPYPKTRYYPYYMDK